MVIQYEIDKEVFYDASEENVKEETAKVLFETTIEEEDGESNSSSRASTRMKRLERKKPTKIEYLKMWKENVD